MPKLKVEKVAGVVALSYLVLIPVAGVLMYRKIYRIDADVTTVWEKLHMDTEKYRPPFQIRLPKFN